MSGLPAKFPELANRILERVKGLPAGSPLPGIVPLSKELGSNFKTVNKAIKRLIDDGVLTRINGKGTFVAAERRRYEVNGNGSTKLVGLTFPSAENPAFLEFACEMSSRCLKNDCCLRVFETALSPGAEKRFIERLRARGCKHLLRFPSYLSKESDILSHAAKLGFRTVMLNDFWGKGLGHPEVRVDERSGARMLVERLCGLGHREIAVFDYLPELRTDFIAGYKDALAAAGIAHAARLIVKDDYSSFVDRLMALLSSPRPPTAAIFSFDCCAFQVIQELRRLGVGVPGDISIAGFDGSSLSSAPDVELTSVRLPLQEMAKEAFKLLMSEGGGSIVLQPELQMRKTTRRI